MFHLKLIPLGVVEGWHMAVGLHKNLTRLRWREDGAGCV
jgi:hypothetical protein